jgi:predicted AAA+ superfamily ATPase
MILERRYDNAHIQSMVSFFPVTAILGSRQCGKTTIAKQLQYDHFFDLENPRDEAKFDNPQLLLENLTGTIIIDEIQRKPDLFPLIRYLVDSKSNQKYIILGSASRDLIRQGAETMAGRIGFYYLSGFSLDDVGTENMNRLWLRGGYPRSYLTETDTTSMLWLDNYITTFLERDIPQLGITIPSHTLRKFWIMISHYHGQIINYSELGRAFGISDHTVKKYLNIFEGTFMIYQLMPWYANVGKRLVKSPKLYIRDSGIFHKLQSIDSYDQLTSHNKIGSSWEGFAMEIIINRLELKRESLFFYKTHSGAELDLLFQKGGKNIGIEFKYADAPKKTKSMMSVINDLQLDILYVLYPGNEMYRLDEKIIVFPLRLIINELLNNKNE